ncbi:MAG: nuclear transport factor 2 family protein [Halioglobus sp.]
MTDAVSRLLAIEDIKRLKARYFRALDSRQWDEFSECFTSDLVADFRGAPGTLSEGRDTFIASLRDVLGDAPTVHHGHSPEIDIYDDNNASGIWAMDDCVDLPGLSLRGWGHYHEQYRREAGQWRISSTRLTRLRLLINGEAQPLQGD